MTGHIGNSARNDCPTGKIAYRNRRFAARAARRIKDGRKMRPYPCEHCDCWHIGHLPRVVVNGIIGADVYYGRRDSDEPAITCPRCGATSYNPNDIRERYCGRCHWWTSDEILGSADVIAQAEHDGALEPLPQHICGRP